MIWRRLFSRFLPFSSLEREMEFQVHWVPPDDIQYRSIVGTHVELDRGRIMGGDWDRLSERFDQLDFFQAYETVLCNGGQWEETDFYQRVVSEMAAGQVKWRCRTEKEFRARLRYVEALYAEMRDLGYVPNHNVEQVSVNVGRHGDLMFNDGQHRLAFAKLLDLSQVPIVLVARHPEWVRFKREILQYALRHGGRLRDPVLHPDLEWVQADYGHKRFKLIRHATRVQSGTLLDLGAHWGYFCHCFEMLGFQCTAVEGSAEDVYFLEKLRRAGNKRFEIVNMPAMEFLRGAWHGETLRYDLVLALDAFEAPAVSKRGKRNFQNLFSRIAATEMYVSLRQADTPAGKWVSWDMRENGFIEFVREFSGFEYVECIGHIEDGRPLYRLAR